MRKFLFCSIFFLLLTGMTDRAMAGNSLIQSTRPLSVVGVGDIKMVPDVARIGITIETEAKEAAEAISQNDGQSGRMLNSLNRFDVAATDVKTTGYTIYPFTKRDPNNYEVVLGTWFKVTHNLTISLRNLNLLGDLVSEVAALDSEIYFHVILDVGDKGVAYASALAAAVVDARSKATIMAAAEGKEVGEVLSMDSNLSEVVPGQSDGRESTADMSIAPGQTSIGVRVNVVFELK